MTGYTRLRTHTPSLVRFIRTIEANDGAFLALLIFCILGLIAAAEILLTAMGYPHY